MRVHRALASVEASLLVVAVATSGCQPPTEVTLELETDLPCGVLRRASIAVGAPGALEGVAPRVEVPLTCRDGKLGSLVMVPSGDRDARFGVKVVAGTTSEGALCPDATSSDAQAGDGSMRPACIVARRSVKFIGSQSLVVPIALRGNCLDKVCDADSTCVDGRCVEAGCPEGGSCFEGDLTKTLVADVSDGILSVAAGYDDGSGKSHSCAVVASGAVRCWGHNGDGQLGLPASLVASSLTPIEVPGVANSVQVVAGNAYTCSLDVAGRVTCWGRALGGTEGAPQFLVPFKDDAPIAWLSAASQVVCGRTTNDGFRCWGPDAKASRRGDLSSLLAFDAGGTQVCYAVGNVPQCLPVTQQSGFSAFPPFVDGLHTNAMPIGIATARVVDDARRFTLVLWSGDGTGGDLFLAGTGANDLQQLGAQETKNLTLSQQVNDAGTARTVFAGGAFACADLEAKGGASTAFQCWGDDAFGQRGNATATKDGPVPVEGLPPGTVRAASLGTNHACVVASDGNAYCWGCGASGQLGDRTSGATCASHLLRKATRVTGLGS